MLLWQLIVTMVRQKKEAVDVVFDCMTPLGKKVRYIINNNSEIYKAISDVCIQLEGIPEKSLEGKVSFKLDEDGHQCLTENIETSLDEIKVLKLGNNVYRIVARNYHPPECVSIRELSNEETLKVFKRYNTSKETWENLKKAKQN